MIWNILSQYGLFLLKVITGVIALVCILASFKKSSKSDDDDKKEITIVNLNEKYDDQKDKLEDVMILSGSKEERKAFKEAEKRKRKEEKEKKKEEKAKSKQEAKNASKTSNDTDLEVKDSDANSSKKSRLFVLKFSGSVSANEVNDLREEITAMLSLAKEGDEALLQLESPGGSVDGYGLGASQLQRIRNHNIPLTVAVDRVAASGGYMMACIADRIVAAPFSAIGSIGVVAQIPNVHRFLKNHDVDVDVVTAGKYKRTMTVFGENTEEGKQKFKEELNEVHQLFKDFVSTHRPQIDIDKIATGEYWYAARAIELKLVDALGTSDDLIVDAMKDKDVYLITTKKSKSLVEKVGLRAEAAVENIITNVIYKNSTNARVM